MEQYTANWREVVNNYPGENERYNVSLNDTRDMLIEYFLELIGDSEEIDEYELASAAHAVDEIAGSLEAIDMGERLHIAGNGLYITENTGEVTFMDGTAGVQGEFDGFAIDSAMPKYSELVYDDEYVYRPVLCIKLANYRTFADNGTQSEANDDTAIVPIMNQDICLNRGLY